jgi:hypothetical protein
MIYADEVVEVAGPDPEYPNAGYAFYSEEGDV